MKKILLSLSAIFFSLALFAQNDKADNITGTYLCGTGIDAYKVQVTKSNDGTYKGTVCWVADLVDPEGKVRTDTKNPDKSLRSTPIDKIVLFSGLSYDAAKQNWNGTKIYDPNRGVRAKMTAVFDAKGTLVITGSLLGISEKVYWTKQ